MTDLKQQTKQSMIWSLLDKAGFQVVGFVVMIITARLLSPKDFGLIGALTIFTVIGTILATSSFTIALIRRKFNTENEYNAVFLFNLLISIALYLILFFSAPLIAHYFEQPELLNLSRFLFLIIIINILSVVPYIKLTRQMDFKKLSLINLLSVTASGAISIYLAIIGYDYWVIAWQQVLYQVFRSCLLLCFGSWKILSKPDFSIISEIFAFSFFLLLTDLMSNGIRYVYNIYIGKVFSIQQLGYYSQANKFQNIPSTVITGGISSVSYPVLAQLIDDPSRQLMYFRKIIRILSFLIFPVILGLIACADNLFSVVLTDKWLPSVPYFRWLLLAALPMPFMSMFLVYLKVQGYGKINFILELIRNILIIVPIFIFTQNLFVVLEIYILVQCVMYAVDFYVLFKKIGYHFINHMMDILPYLIISVFMALIVYALPLYINISAFTALLIQVLVGLITYLGITFLTGSTVLRDVLAIMNKHK